LDFRRMLHSISPESHGLHRALQIEATTPGARNLLVAFSFALGAF
jgi:hypothetical protein